MSYGGGSAGLGYCEAMKIGIGMVGGINDPSFKIVSPVGAVQALLSEMNRPQILQESMTPDSFRPMKVMRLPRATAAQAVAEVNCTAGPEKPITEQEILPETFMEAQIAFNVPGEAMRRYCSDLTEIVSLTNANFFSLSGADRNAIMAMPEFMGALTQNAMNANLPAMEHFRIVLNTLLSQMNGVRDLVDRQTVAKLYSVVGINAATGNNLPISVPVINANSSKAEIGLQTLTRHYATANELNGRYIVLGTGNFESMNISFQYGCCNNDGLDWAGMRADSPYYFFVDKHVPTLGGDPNAFLVLAPGMTQFLFRNLNKEIAGQGLPPASEFSYGLMPDPLVPGLTYDIRTQKSECVNNKPYTTYNVWLSLYHDTIETPDFAFDPTDYLYGVNGIFSYIATQLP